MRGCLSDSTDWYRATTLVERAAVLEGQTFPLSRDADMAVAEARLQRWRQPPTFADAESFGRRLQMEGLTEPQMRHLLAEPARAVALRFAERPDWLEAITAAYDTMDVLPAETGTPDAPAPYMGLLRLAAPLIARARQRLQAQIRQTCRTEAPLPFDPETVDALFLQALAAQLGQMTLRTLTLELNVARLQGRLTGQTPQERFQWDPLESTCRHASLSIL